MTFGEWFDVFTFKREIRDVKLIDEDSIKLIMQQFERVDKLLTDIYDSHDKNYFSIFAYLIYNMKDGFSLNNIDNQNKTRIKQINKKIKKNPKTKNNIKNIF